jgi:phenol hydroxylase P5 protein
MSFQLTVLPLGRTIEVQEGQTILDASLREGLFLPHACCHGVCATCKVQVIDGEVEHGEASPFALMDFERGEQKCLACCATLQSNVTIEADIEEDPDAEELAVKDYDGVVSRIENLTPTIKGIWVKLNHQDGLRFQAGQYINLNSADGETRRAFSLANAPSERGEIELNIRHVPGGRVTGWIHNELAVGETVSLSGPYGRFFVRKSAQLPSLFLAGGSGLSSPRSMIFDLLETGSTAPITLVYGARSRDELYYHDEFVELAARHAHFTYLPALSATQDGDGWSAGKGYVNEVAKAHFDNDFRGHKAYLCGPPPMIDACITTLIQGRLFERDIYTEKFFSAADAQQVRSPFFKSL